jgi:hypothetical protein
MIWKSIQERTWKRMLEGIWKNTRKKAVTHTYPYIKNRLPFTGSLEVYLRLQVKSAFERYMTSVLPIHQGSPSRAGK